MKLFLYALLLAAGLGCTQGMHGMTEEKKVAAQEAHNVTRMMYSAAAGNAKLVTELLDAGVDVNAKKDGLTALMCAVQEPARLPFELIEADKQEDKKLLAEDNAPDKLAVMRILLEQGARVNEEDARGYTALLYAIREYYLNYMALDGNSPKLEPFVRRIEFLLDNGAQYQESPALKRELTNLDYHFGYETSFGPKMLWLPYTGGVEFGITPKWEKMNFEKDVFWLYPPVLYQKGLSLAEGAAAFEEHKARLLRIDAINQRLKALVKFPAIKPHAVQTIQQAVAPLTTERNFPGAIADLIAGYYLSPEDLAVIEKSKLEELVPGRGDAKRRIAEEPVVAVDTYGLALLHSQLLVLSV